MDAATTSEGSVGAPAFAWRPVPLEGVIIDDSFWSPRLAINRERTIPFQYAQCKSTGRIDALRLTWKPGIEPVPHIFWDSDVAKWIEAASYSLATHPDAELDAAVDDVIALLGLAQQPDGYLNTYFTVVRPGRRWTDLRDAHELYCAGHLIEAGVAHYQSTGKRSLLDVVMRYADHIDTVFGRLPGQKRGYCGHEEIELALVKLYRATGVDRYLRLAQYFVDERGRQPHYFDLEASQRDEPGYFESHRGHGQLRTSWEYNQSHVPVREQPEVVGHAVRAMYLYSAMADLAIETGDESLRVACHRLWDHLCAKRLYLTGGIGSSSANEGLTSDYDLPNESAYAETCAAIGLVFWAHRMVQLEGDGRYVDVMERALYNGVMSGVSADGTRFFYVNPLASDGDVARKEWFGVSCCPPNLARLLASLGQYIYSTSATGVAIHLYMQSTAIVNVLGQPVRLRQETNYPWDGTVKLKVSPSRPTEFSLSMRIPGWCRSATMHVNGEAADLTHNLVNGYVQITRIWSDGDSVELDLAMPVERVYSHPQVRANAGCVALMRGPLVYCIEEVDNEVALHRLAVRPSTGFSARFDPTVLGGVVIVEGNADVLDEAGWHGDLYRNAALATTPRPLTAIPYYAWDNRQSGQMRVWIREGGG